MLHLLQPSFISARRLIAPGLAFLLALPTCLPNVMAQHGRELPEPARMHRPPASKPIKLASDLDAMVDAARREGQPDKRQRVILQLSADKLRQMEQSGVRLSDDTARAEWQGALGAYDGQLKRRLPNLGLMVAELPMSRLRELQENGDIAFISPDRPVESFAAGHIETTTGTDSIRELVSGTTLDGRGIGIAVLDSGVDTTHKLLKSSASHPGVVFSRDFVGYGDPLYDRFGHGSHAATMAAGSKELGGGYKGMAPGAKLISLRVLDENGRGLSSAVIAALDWCIANRNTNGYNIRVINLSLGTPPSQSYRTDPLCLAARRAVDAGIVVVASAGNRGKDVSGNKLYGGINSPGIEPSVITVGAANTFGTNIRSDDRVTTFSSRGPTRGFYTDADGVKYYDNLIKPDLVAPGNKLIGAASDDPTATNEYNLLVATYPSLLIGSGKVNDRLMYQSGTSMAAPQVAGAVALLLQAHPTLTPNLVKAILQYTAQPIAGFNTLEQGAGLLNVDGAVRLARLVKTNPSALTNSAPLVTAPLPNPQTSTIAAQTIFWGQGIVTNHNFVTGSDLMSRWQGIYGTGVLLSDATTYANQNVTLHPTLTAGSLTVSQGVFWHYGGLLLNGSLFASGVTLSDGTPFGERTILGDGIIVADSVVFGSNTPRADSAALGDDTACMQPTP